MANTTAKNTIQLKFTADQRADIGKQLMEQVNEARQGMQGALDKIKVWDRFYESDLPKKDFPWKDCSNINIPVIQSHVDTYHAAVVDTILGVDKLMSVLPPSFATDETYKQKAVILENILHSLYSEEMEITETVDEWVLLGIKEQAAIVKMPWREEYQTVRKPAEDPETGGMALMDEITAKYRGPKPELIDLRNFVIYPLTARTVDEAVLVGDRFSLTEDGLRRKVKAGLYDSKAVDKVLEGAGQSERFTEDTLETRRQNEIDGIEPTSFDSYWFWEVIAGYDANGDGLKEDCVFTIEAESGTIVRATVFPYWHGRRWYIPMKLFPRPRRFLGRCIPQMLEGMQRELNAIHNQRIDATTQALTKAFKVRRTREGDGDEIVMAPGAKIFVDDDNEITEFAINPNIPGIEYEQIGRDWAERADAINDVSLGRDTEKQKTLGEIQLVSQKSGQRFSVTIQRVHAPLVEMTRQVVGLLHQFLTDEEIMVLGGGEFTRDDFLLSWRYMPRGTLGAADKQNQQQTAMLMYQTLSQNPLVSMNPLYIYKLTQELLMAFDKQDIESYIGTEEELRQQMDAAAQQQAAQQQMEAELGAAGVGQMGGYGGGMAQPGNPASGQAGGGGQVPSF